MISLADYTAHDGLGLAALVASRQVSAAEALDAALRATEQVNPRLNAVLQTLPAEAQTTIKHGLPHAPFAGVPFMVKELVLHAQNIRCDMGSRLAQGMVPATDTELMRRFRAAGLVLCGTTQTPELGYNPTTETVLFGPVHNPWDLSRSAGGSSGGSGAAVAAGIVPVAHANDGGGSIRIPAACNGLVGLKPTRFRIPSGPDYGNLLCGLAIEFALTRTVRDAAALLDCVAGRDTGAPGEVSAPAQSYLSGLNTAPRRLRIAWSTKANSGQPVDQACIEAVQTTVRLLTELGHTLIEDQPRYDWEEFLGHTHVFWTTFTASAVDALAAVMRRKVGPEMLEAVTLACYEDGKRYSAIDLLRAMDHANALSRNVGAFFQQYDVLLTPTMSQPAAPLGQLNQDRAGISAMDWTRQVFEYVPFTPLFNTTGQPAISLPLYWTAAGLPVGVQCAGRYGDEATLLQLAAQLEEAQPWSRRRPPVHAAN